MGLAESRRWVDREYGPGGLMLYGFLLGWLVAIYCLYQLVNADSHVWAVDGLLILFNSVLVIGGGIWIFSCWHRTAYCVKQVGEGRFVFDCYFFRSFQAFSKDVVGIYSFEVSGIKRLTPLGGGLMNYRLLFHDGSYCFLSGRTNKVGEFIELISCLSGLRLLEVMV